MAEENRTQPEFSTGERLASVEAAVKALASKDEMSSLKAATDGHWRLDEERADRTEEATEALRRELQTSIEAQDKAINKAEEAQLRQAELTREQADRREEIANQRLLALERGDSSVRGEHEGATRLRTETIAWIAGIAAVATAIILIVHG